MKSLQNWARELRYDYFFKILEEENLDYIVTAHHLNDELETFSSIFLVVLELKD